MNLSDLLFAPLIWLLLTTLVLLLMLGATVVYPRSWDATLHSAALREIERRFAGLGPRSQADLIAANRLIGHEVSSDDDDVMSDSVLDAVLVLTDAGDRIALDAELTVLRAELEKVAIRRQVYLVSKVADIRTASYLWVVGNVLSRARFAAVGFVWFFPRALPFLNKRLQRHGKALALIGVLVGVAWAAIVRSPQDKPFDWLSLASNVALSFTISGIVVAILGLYKAILVARFGEIRQWTHRGILMAAISFVVPAITMSLNLTGVVSEWQREVARLLQDTHVADDGVRWLGSVVMAGFIIYVIVNGYRWIRNSAVTLSDRLWMLAGMPLLLVMLALVILYAFDAALVAFDWVFPAGAGAMLVLGAFAGIVTCIEWVQKYKLLRISGVVVPKKGFRWWVLITWAVAGLILCGAFQYVIDSGPFAGIAASSAVLVVLDLALALWTLFTLPGLLITWLYARRVLRTFETFRFEQAPLHPDLAEADSKENI